MRRTKIEVQCFFTLFHTLSFMYITFFNGIRVNTGKENYFTSKISIKNHKTVINYFSSELIK